MTPRVSIGLPVHNGEPFLGPALEALAAQTFTDFEAIVSDNASTDGTEGICRRFCEADPRFRYFRQETNRGAAWNYNEVVREARGELFKWAAHDDLVAPTFIARCAELLGSAPPGVALCYPKTVVIDAEGREIEEYEDLLDLRADRASERYAGFLEGYTRSNALFGLHRLERLRRTRLHGNYVSADTILLAEIALNGQIWELPERLFLRRYHEGMSLRVHVGAESITEWFDPGRRTGHLMPRTRLFAEHIRAIARCEAPLPEKARCARILVSRWGRRYGRVIGGEIKGEILGLLGAGRRG